MVKPLPPLNAVRAFEAASRHLNLSRAAEELGVTQGAISKQVIALEDFIGVQLFIREPSGLRLTAEGGNLKEAIEPAFTTLSEAFARYSRRSPRSNIMPHLHRRVLRLAVPRPAPRAFHERFPGYELEFLTSIRLVDLAREEFDIAVRYGPGGWDDVVSDAPGRGPPHPRLHPAVFARANGDLATLLASTRKIQSSASNEWRAWAVEAKLPVSAVTPTFTMEEFTVAIAGALAGEGLALAPDVLVRDRLARGELVQFSDITVKPGYAYHIVHAPNAARRPILVELIAWLKDEAGAA